MKLPKKDCQFNSSEQGSFLVYILVGLAVLGLIIAGIYFYFKPSLNLPKQITNPQKTNINTDFNVLIVGWDGAQWDTFNACYRKVEPACAAGLPNIKELSGGGKRIFFNIVGNGETETFPGWPQLLTGYNSGYTKIIDKKTYQPVPKGGTLLEKLKKGLGSNNIATIYIGVRDTIVSSCKGDILAGRTNFGEEGETTNLPAPTTNTNTIDEQGGPWCNMKSAIDLFINDPFKNQGTGEQALAALDKYKDKRFVMFTLFADADDAGHKKGGASDDYLRGLIDDDMWLGKLMDKLKELKIDQKTLIYVVSDHGWDNEPRASTPSTKKGADTHDDAPFGVFVTNDNSIIRPGDRRDLTPTILSKYGLSLGEDKELNLAAVNGYPLDAPLPFTSIPKGGVYIEFKGMPKCESGSSVIPFSKFIQQRDSCFKPQGGTNIVAGFCANCGNNVCEPPENQCNCPTDCK